MILDGGGYSIFCLGLVNQSRFERAMGFDERVKGSQDVRVGRAGGSQGCIGQRETAEEDEFLMILQKFFSEPDIFIRESIPVQLHRTFVQPRLFEISAIERAGNIHLALLAAAQRADFAADSGAVTFRAPGVTDLAQFRHRFFRIANAVSLRSIKASWRVILPRDILLAMKAKPDPDITGLLPLSPQVFHILLALADREQHGYGIMQDVEARTGGKLRLSPGTLYGSMKRMLEQGLVSELRESERPAAKSDDERRRYYRLTALGRSVVRAEASRMAELLQQARVYGLAPKRS